MRKQENIWNYKFLSRKPHNFCFCFSHCSPNRIYTFDFLKWMDGWMEYECICKRTVTLWLHTDCLIPQHFMPPPLIHPIQQKSILSTQPAKYLLEDEPRPESKFTQNQPSDQQQTCPQAKPAIAIKKGYKTSTIFIIHILYFGYHQDVIYVYIIYTYVYVYMPYIIHGYNKYTYISM